MAGQIIFPFNRKINSNIFSYIAGKKLCSSASLGPALNCLLAHWVREGCSSLRKIPLYWTTGEAWLQVPVFLSRKEECVTIGTSAHL